MWTAVNPSTNHRDFGKAAAVSEWLRANRPDNVSVLYKIGAVDNMGSSTTALTPSDIVLSTELARGRFSIGSELSPFIGIIEKIHMQLK